MTVPEAVTPPTGTDADLAALLDPVGVLTSAAALPTGATGSANAVTPDAALGGRGRTTGPPDLEKAWAQAHPGGQVDRPGDGQILLWNFDPGRSELKPEHVNALIVFNRAYPLGAPVLGSATGHTGHSATERSHRSLASDRAAAIAAWFLQNGDLEFKPSAGEPLNDDESGEGMARARAVALTAPPPSTVPVSASPWQSAPVPGQAPVAVACTTPRTQDFSFGALPLLTITDEKDLPIAGELSFSGRLRVTYPDEQACADVQAKVTASGVGGGVDASVTKDLFGWLKERITAGIKIGRNGVEFVGSLGAVVGGWTIDWDPAQHYQIVIKSPTIPFTSVDADGLVVPLVIMGSSAAFSLTGQFQFSCRPTPTAVAELIKIVGPALEGAGAIALLFAILLGILWLARYLGDSDGRAERWGAISGAKYAFAAEIAVALIPGTVDDVADQFLKERYPEGLRVKFGPSVDQGRRDATAALTALGDARAARITALTAKYAVTPNGAARHFDEVQSMVFSVLGGTDHNDSTPPSLDRL